MAISKRQGDRADWMQNSQILAAGKIIAIPLMMLLGLFYWNYVLRTSDGSSEDLCSSSRPVVASTVLLVDRTDPITTDEKQYLHNIVQEIASHLAPGDQFSMFSIDGEVNSQLPTALWSACMPGTAADSSELTSSPTLVQRKFEQGFLQPLNAKIDQLNVDRTAPTSPIIETIQALTNLRDFSSNVKVRKLYIFSDMIQNGRYSQYRSPPTIPFRSIKSDKRLSYVVTELKDVDVTVYYVPRPRDAKIQGDRHLAWWRDYFSDAGARVSFNMVVR